MLWNLEIFVSYLGFPGMKFMFCENEKKNCDLWLEIALFAIIAVLRFCEDIFPRKMIHYSNNFIGPCRKFSKTFLMFWREKKFRGNFLNFPPFLFSYFELWSRDHSDKRSQFKISGIFSFPISAFLVTIRSFTFITCIAMWGCIERIQ